MPDNPRFGLPHEKANTVWKKSGVQWARIQKIERNNDITQGVDEKLKLIKQTFEKNGIEFCVSNDNYLGYVRLLKNK